MAKQWREVYLSCYLELHPTFSAVQNPDLSALHQDRWEETSPALTLCTLACCATVELNVAGSRRVAELPGGFR